ncbi:hypothetical protein [Kaistella jeonii]|uniref:Uncharacterized protein n=1 Tax=Kaistella jeonii TaxID=266749 RepID=A0A0C1F9N5_9FLAO|nr:hypothetical protein [Kaistella jeonii]KIA89862.1 hypothetical protein OA86_04370 [Kaistella jeonii]SFB84683.1 hypothetical protein SAMN05421876_10311 [Kaistella jeonii]VEI96100.1 Uncharacterised protein [Kaistella jeonii]
MATADIKIHDNFTLEIKLRLTPFRKQKETSFSMNSWIFLPKSIDINEYSFSKRDFYKNLKSNIRLITPIFNLHEIVDFENSPLQYLAKSFDTVAHNPTKSFILDYKYNIRMFLAILKSSLRNEIIFIKKSNNQEERDFLIDRYYNSVNTIFEHYRNLKNILTVHSVTIHILKPFYFGDEFMSNLVEKQNYKLLQTLVVGQEKDDLAAQKIKNLISKELEYKKAVKYAVFEKNKSKQNRDLLSRLGFLKKFAESELYLTTLKERDGVFIEQISMSIAAGISMIFATAIAFGFQQKFGNLTMPFFVALVVSYILKDRIKEFARYYLVHKLSNKFFDQKININMDDKVIGTEKESFDYIDPKKIPEMVMRLRKENPVSEDINTLRNDNLILYRKMITLNREKLDELSFYAIPGINEIIRLNISSFVFKMDNAYLPIFVPTENNAYEVIQAEKVYFLDMVLQLNKNEVTTYAYYRITLNRVGILSVEKIASIK